MEKPGRKHPKPRAGFTLIELLIVITILVILAGVLIFVLNPVETLRKSRDAQRLRDLATLKNSIGLYITSVSTAYLAGASSNTGCKIPSGYSSGDVIYYSYPSDTPGATITDSTLDAGSASIPAAGQVTRANLRKVDATGWLPVSLTSISGGSPISSLPLDPTNTITSVSAVSASDLVYRYACDSSDTTFEVDANLESSTYTSDPDNKEKDDGGNNDNLHEVGTKLNILGTGTDF